MTSLKDEFEKVDSPAFWNSKYLNNQATWDISGPTPAFINWFKNKNKNKNIIIPGSGNSHDAIFLANLNYNVCAVDFSTSAVNNVKNNKMKNLAIFEQDYFDLDSSFNNTFDYFLEYTFYCAINPNRRNEYIKKSYNLLKPNGKFVGFLLPINKSLKDGGPPYGIDLLKTEKLFSKYFTNINICKSEYSINPRKDIEVFITMDKNA